MYGKDNLVYDAGSVDGSDGSRVAGCQFTTPARTSAGVYTLTLEDGIDSTEGVCLVTIRDAVDARIPTIVWTSDTVITVSVVDEAVAAADAGFDFVILNLVGV